MSKSKNKTFLLSDIFESAFAIEKLQELKATYQNSFKSSTFFIPTGDVLTFMLSAKRDKITFGPYQDLTFFEISNRIYSDFVLLKAAEILFTEHKIKSIKLKMSNHAGNDLVVLDKNNNKIVGEAFNTAYSFFQIKLRSELRKFSDNKLGIIAFNSCALNDKNKVFLEKKKLQFPKVLFIECKI